MADTWTISHVSEQRRFGSIRLRECERVCGILSPISRAELAELAEPFGRSELLEHDICVGSLLQNTTSARTIWLKGSAGFTGSAT